MSRVKHTPEDARLFRLAAAGDPDASECMLKRNLGLVQNLATYYAKRNSHLDMDDLLQEGRIGVFVALRKFNVDKGYRFSTYATYWIKHYIQRYVVENHSGAATARKKDTEDYLGERMSDEEMRTYEARCIRHMSISSETPGGTTFEEIIEDRDEVPFDEEVVDRERWRSVERTLFHETVDARHRTVLCMRFGVLGHRPHTINEVAGELGIPPVRVTAIEQTAVMHISRLMEETDGDDGDPALDSGEAAGQAASAARKRQDVHAEADGAGRGAHRAGVAGCRRASLSEPEPKGAARAEARPPVPRRAS